ncbi:MAG: hypothetical protein IT582_08935 [Opitutaceae bacterium]|nr:hypothetical protein [Opitutaceae bacterium]
MQQLAAAETGEGVFQTCFGLNYVEAEQALRRYLPTAVKRTFYLAPPRIAAPGAITFREATVTEVTQLKGRLERLEIPYVRRVYPMFAERYIAQARKTLTRLSSSQDHDPRIMAELGLLECEAGDDIAAEPWLQQAAAAKIIYPRVYAELARITYTRMRETYPHDNAPPEAIAALLEPLSEAHAQSPALPGIHERLCEAWLRYGVKLTPREFEMVDESVRLFPRRFRILYAATLLNLGQGRTEPARNLVARGLSVFSEGDEQARFVQLQHALEATP